MTTAETLTGGAMWVQRRRHGQVRDAGIYCRPCVVNGLFKFTAGAGDDLDDELVVGHFTVAVADDAVICAGCGTVLNP